MNQQLYKVSSQFLLTVSSSSGNTSAFARKGRSWLSSFSPVTRVALMHGTNLGNGWLRLRNKSVDFPRASSRPCSISSFSPSLQQATKQGLQIRRFSARHGESGESRKLYDTHIPTTPIEKMLLAARAAVGALNDPERADLVAALGDTTGYEALKRMQRLMTIDEVGREVLRDRPVVSEETVRMEELRGYAPGTFGRAYADFMDSRGFVADERPIVRFVDEEELAYIMRRYREIHDYVHVLTGLGTTVEGEIVQKWLELLHTGLPVCLLSAVVGPLKLSPLQHLRLATEWVPWVARCSASTPFILNVYYERLFKEDLGELRKRFGVPPLPYGVPPQSAGWESA